MKKVYVLWPVIGMLVFTGFYWNFTRGAAERQHQVELRQQEERKARILKEAESRKRAIEDAIAAQAKRAAERAAKEKKTEEENAARQALLDKRNQVFEDVNKRLHPQLDRLKSDADEINASIAQLEMQKKQYLDEEAFLRTYVTQAQANVKTYYAILDRITAAEKARAEAEAAARVAKKD
jgi:Flp pilus assembly protein TadB